MDTKKKPGGNVIPFPGAKRPAPAIKQTISGNGNVGVIGDSNQVHITIQRARVPRPVMAHEPDEISNEQAAVIKKLVNDVARHTGFSHARVYDALYGAVNTTSYLKIKQDRFEEAALYLKKWLARFVKKAAPTDQEDLRKHLLKRIHAEARKRRGRLGEIHAYIQGRHGTPSLADLTPGQLQEVVSHFGL
jgi:hypothetical protein